MSNQYDDALAQKEAMQAFINSEGWKFFSAHLAERKIGMQNTVNEPAHDQFAAMKGEYSKGALNELETLRVLPAQLLAEAVEMLEMFEAEANADQLELNLPEYPSQDFEVAGYAEGM